jgi:osmotically-inducible protein OsmY
MRDLGAGATPRRCGNGSSMRALHSLEENTMRTSFRTKAALAFVATALAWPLAAAPRVGEAARDERKARTDDRDDVARPDGWITLKTKLALLTAADLGAGEIDVDTDDGRVTLKGKVETAAEKARAERVAGKIEGVKEVRNRLQVVPESRKEQVKATDAQVKERLRDRLEREESLDDVEVASVDAGVVVLKGDVEKLSHELKAVEEARKIPGVRRVSSRIEVDEEKRSAGERVDKRPARTAQDAPRPAVKAPRAPREAPARDREGADREKADREKADREKADRERPARTADSPDAWLTLKTKVALLTAKDVSGTAIDVDTAEGRVTLHGKVATAEERAKAEQVARGIDGVQDVQNLLQVVPEAKRDVVQTSDSEVRERVEEALRADESVKGVSVASVNAGVVLLDGKVTSLRQSVRALEIANKVPGVRQVASEMVVEGEKDEPEAKDKR